ncbi:MAG: PorV/PorQ family protein [Bacteroidetes bacterium]|nr:PorV/PorQ family protein [Bacteroidota bacterium]
MKKYFLIIFIFFQNILNAQNIFPIFGSQRTGTSAFTFLQISASPRGLAMSDAFNSLSDDASSLHYNPARAVLFHRSQTMVSHGLWFAGLQHNYSAFIYKYSENEAIGLAINSLMSEQMEKRTEFLPEGTGEKFIFNDFSLALTFSKRLTDQFSFGITSRYITETLAEYKMDNLLFDLGISYDLGNDKSQFAITYSNFGGSSKPKGTNKNSEKEFEEFLPPSIFAISFANKLIKEDDYNLITVVQLNHPNDNSENFAIGAELEIHKMFYLRSGFRINYKEQNFPSFGVGFVIPYEIFFGKFDYGVAKYNELGLTHNFSLNIIL